ncbi:MAG: hypothetical protein J6J36_05285 [Clostridia bacterium]|nr:hypothetical protein [Clostridia bacterium]
MKRSWKRKVIVKVKSVISKIVLFFLYKGFKLTYRKDLSVKSEIEPWKEGFTFGINTGIQGVNLIIKKENGKLIRLKEENKLDLEIVFKSIDVAFLMFTGRLGVSKAYAEHRFILKGEIGKAMSLVRCIDIVEAYLFPKIISKRILKEVPNKSMGLIKTYGEILITR